MLTSLFGDLGPRSGRAKARDFDDTQPDSTGFAATAIMETVATEVNERGQIIDRHLSDLVVTGSAAEAIRQHFAETRADLGTATSMITLLDPVGVWASAVVKALSDAGGRPIERLHLREQGTLRTLAMIERTTLVRRQEDTLRIFHADVRTPGADTAEIPVALMERSQMTAVIVGPMAPHAVDGLLASLRHASRLPDWRCPHLLFQLPPNAPWIEAKVRAIRWPERLHVHVVSEPMISASSVWNAMLAVWNRVRLQPGWEPDSVAPMLGGGGFPIKVGELGTAATANPLPATDAAGAASPIIDPDHTTADAARYEPGAASAGSPVIQPGIVDPARHLQVLAPLLRLEGLLGCALVDGEGRILAHEKRDDQNLDMKAAAAACTRLLHAHRQAAGEVGLGEPIDEIITTSGPRHLLLRALPRHAGLFVVALLDKHRTNLALARFQLLEVERGLP